jgi:hypothetical protein
MYTLPPEIRKLVEQPSTLIRERTNICPCCKEMSADCELFHNKSNPFGIDYLCTRCSTSNHKEEITKFEQDYNFHMPWPACPYRYGGYPKPLNPLIENKPDNRRNKLAFIFLGLLCKLF